MSRTIFLLNAVFTTMLAANAVAAEPQGTPGHPPTGAVGATAPDPFPNGCVDCHRNYPERNMDVRLSTLLVGWRKEVEPRLLAKARAASAPGAKLAGKHPEAAGSLSSIPGGCLTCHSSRSTNAPPFASMMHAIHLTGGPENHYIAHFQGACTHCHKLDAATGRVRVPTGPER